MKKLLLLFIIMLTFSITTVSVSASTTGITPDTQFTNILGTEGSFKNDADSNDVADGWELQSSINPTLIDGVQKAYANGLGYYFGFTKTDVSIEVDHVYYVSYTLETNAVGYETKMQFVKGAENFSVNVILNEQGKLTGTFSLDAAITVDTFKLYIQSTAAPTNFGSNIYLSVEEFVWIDLTAVYGAGSEPSTEDFDYVMKVDYFDNTVVADQILSFDMNTRVEHYLYDAPDLFEDFPNNLTMENIIRVAFFIPLMIVYFLLIPLFNFLFSGSVTGMVLLGLLILAFILREVIRFIDPDFHLFGKNSYYEGFERPPPG